MNMIQDYYFISDLHLHPDGLENIQAFKTFIQSIARPKTALYILGDFFDYWVGDDDLNDFTRDIIWQLRFANHAGLSVYLMHGNRDFLLGKGFCQLAACELLTDPTILKQFGQTIVLTHGDLMCTDDIEYLKFRRLVRNRLFQLAFLSTTWSYRQKMAQKARHKSKSQQKIVDVTTQGIEQMARYQPDLLIHGHTHLKDQHQHDGFNRWVLGDWHKGHGSYIHLNANGVDMLDFDGNQPSKNQ